MKKLMNEFKAFITRGNVVDLAVGVIIGSAFTAIVTALTTNILTPLINGLLFLILGESDLSEIYTFLVYNEDLTKAIYIDWGAFISAIINFLLIAMVLFIIVKIINNARENNEKFKNNLANVIPTKQERKEMKTMGLNPKKHKDVLKYRETKKAEQEQLDKAEEEKKKAEEEEKKKHTTEGLLEQILDLLKKQEK